MTALLAFCLQVAPDWVVSGDGELGRSLAVLDADGDGFKDLLVGSPGESAAFLYRGGPGGPSVDASWTATGPSRFGFRVARAGDVNGDGYEDAAVGDLERTHVFLGSAAGLETAAAWTAPGAVPAGVGDVDGDGFDDLAVGDPSGVLGKVSVYPGSATGLATAPVWTAAGDGQAFSGFGAVIAPAGDVDGDGFSDFLVSAPGHDRVVAGAEIDVFYSGDLADPVDLPVDAQVVPDTGRVWLIAGSADGPERTPRWTRIGTPVAREAFGLSLAGGSDVDGDGRPDAIAASGRAEAVVFNAYGSGLSPTPHWIRVGAHVDSETPVAVGMGDVDGDGTGDVVMVDRLSMRVFEGPGLAGGPAQTSTGPEATFRAALAVGDLDGDGRDDVATSGNGDVRVFFGRAAAAPAPSPEEPPPTVAAASASADGRSSSEGCGLIGVEALLALAYFSSRMRRARNQTSSP